MFRRSKDDNKAKLQHKLYLARENPEPVFDLAECDLKQVPNGIYSLCRVFLKQELRLQKNQLTSLENGGLLEDLHKLRVLDLHCNRFTRLPDDIGVLISLEELYLNDNRLKYLPSSVCKLESLRVLNLKDNCLKLLPENIGNLHSVQLLDLRGNSQLKTLPKTLHRCSKLVTLELDGLNFNYPPANVTSLDTQAILSFISNDVGADYVPQSPSEVETVVTTENDFEVTVRTLDEMKREKMRDFLEMEKLNELTQRQEYELAASQKLDREKLLADISQRQNKLDMDLVRVHQEKELDRARLVEQLMESEDRANVAIKQLLELNSRPHENLLALEQQEEERLLSLEVHNERALRTNDILTRMNDILQQEFDKYQQYERNRHDASLMILQQDSLIDKNIEAILRSKELQKSEMNSSIRRDARLQRAAFGALLERGDSQSWGILQQVLLVEQQLATLTAIEADRRRLRIDDHLNDLAVNRAELSVMLVTLLERRDKRRAQLLAALERMEVEMDTKNELFWLSQYQNLMDRLPERLSELQKNMDPRLMQSLLVHGTLHCLPFLAKLLRSKVDLGDISRDDLNSVGITDVDLQQRLLDSFQIYDKESVIPRPTAPPLCAVESAEIVRRETECSICMDADCEVIYVPCGHFCCCLECSKSMNECPMCRTAVEKKIRVISS